ncbi:MAG: HD domain-containing protein, partial [Akkermansiaceae bacterium]
MTPHPPSLHASIHIGASSISMLVVESDLDMGDEEQPGDFLEQSVPIARDLFRQGKIKRNTIERCVRILNGYLDSLRELGATEETPIRIVATNILSEASNYDVLINRIMIGCGLEIEMLDDGEMTRLIYLKTRRRLKDTPSMKNKTALVVHVGPGNTRALLFHKGRISDYSNYRLGAYRTGESLDNEDESETSITRNIAEHIRSQISQIQHDYAEAGVSELILIGYEIQQLSSHLSKPGKTKSSYTMLAELSDHISSLNEEQRVKQYQIDYTTAQSIVPALAINLAIAKALSVQTLRLPDSDYERGLLQDLPVSSAMTEGFQNEVLRSADSLAKKYRVHLAHATQVSRLCQLIFESTQELHDLSEHDALLLACAGRLHECGNFISSRAHHKHSHYIIKHNEIFGLGEKDILLVALMARYHRRSGPKTSHPDYRELSTTDRMRVSKLASILRIADALDRTHTSRVGEVTIAIEKSKLVLTLHGMEDASIERIAMRSK